MISSSRLSSTERPRLPRAHGPPRGWCDPGPHRGNRGRHKGIFSELVSRGTPVGMLPSSRSASGSAWRVRETSSSSSISGSGAGRPASGCLDLANDWRDFVGEAPASTSWPTRACIWQPPSRARPRALGRFTRVGPVLETPSRRSSQRTARRGPLGDGATRFVRAMLCYVLTLPTIVGPPPSSSAPCPTPTVRTASAVDSGGRAGRQPRRRGRPPTLTPEGPCGPTGARGSWMPPPTRRRAPCAVPEARGSRAGAPSPPKSGAASFANRARAVADPRAGHGAGGARLLPIRVAEVSAQPMVWSAPCPCSCSPGGRGPYRQSWTC